jgi:1,4-alpha-glucan branching enzyme
MADPAVFFSRHRSIGVILLCLLLGGAIWVQGCSHEAATLGPEPPSSDPSGLAKARIDTFVLKAYSLDSVHVAGSFNAWNGLDPAWEMTLQADGYTWRLVAEVPDGLIQYKFVLRMDGLVEWLTDPAAVEVIYDGYHSNPAYWNSVRGRQITTPAPLAEPIDRTKLIIYEISLNDFSATGSFAGATAGLSSGPDLESLGVNAIELMPVTTPSYNGWGYDPVLQFAPNPWLGWPTTFAALVDAAHDRGMAVILDSVINHMSGSAPLRQLDDFTGEYNFTTSESNPWGLVELNWANPALREHILASLCHWVDVYKVDGFRFDYIGGESYTTWVWIKNELEARYPNLLLIAEDFNYATNGNAVTNGYDAQWGGNHTDSWGGGGNNFCQVMATALNENGFAWRGEATPSVGAFGAVYNNMWAVANVLSGNSQYAGGVPGDGFSDIKFLESHDENRVVWSVNNVGSAGAQSIGGLTKAYLGAVIQMTSVGIPMIYNGQEIGSGEYRPVGTSTYKIDWAGGDQNLLSAYRRLIDLRLNEPALATENIFFHWRDGGLDQQEFTLLYWRGSTTDQAQSEVVVAANFDHVDHALTVPFPTPGYWARHNLAQGTVNISLIGDTSLDIDLPASSAILWVKANGTTGVPLSN